MFLLYGWEQPNSYAQDATMRHCYVALSPLNSHPDIFIITNTSLLSTTSILSILSGSCVVMLTGHSSYVMRVIQLADGRLCSSSEDKSMMLWNPSSGELPSDTFTHSFTLSPSYTPSHPPFHTSYLK